MDAKPARVADANRVSGPRPWAIRVPLLVDESISSWLVRAAMSQGCDPMALVDSLQRGWRPFATDADRGLPDGVRRTAEARAGLRPGTLSTASIRPQAEALAGQALADRMPWPWVLAMGSRNAQRKGGLQFCVDCWREDAQPYFRRRWRYAFVAACPVHGGLMVDACPRCDKALHPHRLTADARVLSACAACRCDLRRLRSVRADGEAIDFAGHAVRHMGADPSVCRPFFESAAFAASLVRKAARQPRGALAAALLSIGVDLGSAVLALSGTGLKLELLTPAQRAALWRAAWPLTVGPGGLEALIDRPGLTRSSFLCGAPMPPAFQPLVERLLPGALRRTGLPRKRANAPQPERAVRGSWARLQRALRSMEGRV